MRPTGERVVFLRSRLVKAFIGAALSVVAASLSLAAAQGAVTDRTAATTRSIPGAQLAASTRAPVFGHVFVIVGENKSLRDITLSDAPYIVKTLKPESAWFTNYSDVARGSLADYVALTSGQFAPCQTRGPCGEFQVPSIFSQLGHAKWVDWNESMPSNCDRKKETGSTSALNAYKAGHNPGLYYAGLPCSSYDRPAGTTGADDMSAFNRALAAGKVPKYNFVTPNECEDGYHDCNGPHTIAYAVTEFDDFLKKEIPLIENSPAFGSNGVIFTTLDEGSRGDANTMMIVTGPQVLPGTYSGAYNHYSALATIEQGLGVPCLAAACGASALPAFGNR